MSSDEALTESTNEIAPAKIDLQAVLLITHDNTTWFKNLAYLYFEPHCFVPQGL